VSCAAAAAAVMGVLAYRAAGISAKYEDLRVGNETAALGTLVECSEDMLAGGNIAIVCERAKNAADTLGLFCVRRFADSIPALMSETTFDESCTAETPDNETLRQMALECADKLRRQCALAIDSAERADAVAAIPLIFEQFDAYLTLTREAPAEYASLENLPQKNEREAKELAYGIFDRALTLRTSRSCGGEPLWIFSCDSAYAAFTCRGGLLISMSASRPEGEAVIGEEEALEHMLYFIAGQGIPNAVPTLVTISGSRIDAVYSCGGAKGEVSCSVSLSDGRICAFDADDYYRYL